MSQSHNTGPRKTYFSWSKPPFRWNFLEAWKRPGWWNRCSGYTAGWFTSSERCWSSKCKGAVRVTPCEADVCHWEEDRGSGQSSDRHSLENCILKYAYNHSSVYCRTSWGTDWEMVWGQIWRILTQRWSGLISKKVLLDLSQHLSQLQRGSGCWILQFG